MIRGLAMKNQGIGETYNAYCHRAPLWASQVLPWSNLKSGLLALV